MSQMQAVGSAGSGGSINDGVSSSIKATVFDYTTSNPLATTLVDTNGDPVSVGGGTQYTEDAAAPANPVGTAVNLVRQDTPTALVTTDGDNVTQRGTNYGAAYAQIVTSAGAFVDTFGGGTQYTEGDVDTSITGTAMIWEDTGDTLRAVSAAKPLPIGDAGGSLTVDNSTLAVVGGGTEAAAMRVTIASDSTGVLSIDDNGGAITVDGTVAATQSGTWTEANSAAIAASASVLDDWDETNRAAVNTIAGQVGVQGASGVVTALTQRVVLATDVGLPAGTSNIGDVDVLTLPNVTIGTMANLTESLVDDAAFTPATSRVIPVGYTFDDSAPDSVNEGDIGAARMSANRNIYNTIRDAAGNERGANVSAGNALLVDGSATTQPVSGTVTVTATNLDIRDLAAATDTITVHGDVGILDQFDLTSSNPAAVAIVDGDGVQITSFGGGTQYTEDVAAAADPVGTMGIAVRADSLAAVTSTDGDNIAYRATNKGELYVKQTDAVPVTDNSGSLTVDNAGTFAVQAAQSGTWTEANSAAIAASASVLDDWDETDRAKVNIIVGQAGIAAGTGTDGATVPRVTLATNVALPAGTNAIGKLAANSGVDIGDVDVASIATGTNAIGRVGHDITGIGHGVKTVTSAGTDEALAGSTACKRVVVQAQTDNTSGIAVGASGVDAVVATGTGVYLNPGDAFELEIDNLADVFIDALVSGEGVRYTYFT